MLWIELAAIETLSVPGELNWPARLNSTVWASIQVRLVAWTGDDGLTAEPERTRSVARDVCWVDVSREGHGDGRRASDGDDVEPLRPATSRRRSGTSEVVTTRKAPPIGVPPVPSNSKAPTSRGPIAGQAEAVAVDLDLGVAQEVGRDRRGFPGVVDRRRDRRSTRSRRR